MYRFQELVAEFVIRILILYIFVIIIAADTS